MCSADFYGYVLLLFVFYMLSSFIVGSWLLANFNHALIGYEIVLYIFVSHFVCQSGRKANIQPHTAF